MPTKINGNPFASIDEVNNYQENNVDIENLRVSARSIEKTATELCKDASCNRIEFRINEKGNVFIDCLDDEAYSCLFDSFERNRGIIPAKTYV